MLVFPCFEVETFFFLFSYLTCAASELHDTILSLSCLNTRRCYERLPRLATPRTPEGGSANLVSEEMNLSATNPDEFL